MPNEFLSGVWVERVERLALGLEPIDAARGLRVAHPIHVIFDDEVKGLPQPKVQRHPSRVHALLYERGVGTRVKLRFVEVLEPLLRGDLQNAPRRIVPRVISFPVATKATVDTKNFQNRVRRPFLFPGAAYDLPSGATGLRGRVLRAGKPVRWARVEAMTTDTAVIVGRAHGDDRGEFLLLIDPAASGIGDLVDPLEIDVQVYAPPAPPANPPAIAKTDPFWDLPEETAIDYVGTNFDIDAVSSGVQNPAVYAAYSNRRVALTLGEVQSGIAPFT